MLGGVGPVRAVERVYDSSEADERVLDHLARLGCDPGAARRVTHYVYLRTADGAIATAGTLERGGWRATTEPCDDGWFLVVATRNGTLSTSIVKETRRTFESLAAEHGGVYDGWEAEAG
jgi:hypothetical protein